MREPTFWRETDLRSRRAAPLTRMLLTPAAQIYAWTVRRRIERTDPFDAGVPVICVGNLTVGGVGKTPIVKAVRDTLVERGRMAATLSRGYGGSMKGPMRVDPARHSAAEVGDEPLMLARTGEAFIGADRAAAAGLMADEGMDAIVMDDGFQNPGLRKTVSILVFDRRDPVGNGFIVPKGPLREPVEAGLARADAVILMGEAAEEEDLDGIRTAFEATLKASGLPVLTAKVASQSLPPTGPLVAFAGIGNPQKFFDTLQTSGAELSETIPFPDHHSFSSGDIAYLRTIASERGARLITTEKDHIRLPTDFGAMVETFPITVIFDDPAQFDALIDKALGE